MATKAVIVDALNPSNNRSVIGDTFRFSLPNGQQIEVAIRQDRKEVLEIRCTTGTIRVTPWATNVITVGSERF